MGRTVTPDVSLNLARIVFNPTICLLGAALALVVRGIGSLLELFPEPDRLPWELTSGPVARALGSPYRLGLPTFAVLTLSFALLSVAIARVAALKVTLGETCRVASGLRFSAQNWISGALYPIALLLSALLVLLLIGLLGLVAQIPFLGSILLVLIVPVAVVLGALFAVVLTLGFVAAPVIAAGLAVERSGALDAISRTFSYAFSRPAAFIFYALLVVALAATTVFIGRFALDAAHWGLGFLIRGETLEQILSASLSNGALPAGADIADTFAAQVLRVVWYLAHAAVDGAGVGLLFSGGLAIYLTLRRDVDGIPITELEMAHSASSGSQR